MRSFLKPHKFHYRNGNYDRTLKAVLSDRFIMIRINNGNAIYGSGFPKYGLWREACSRSASKTQQYYNDSFIKIC